MGEDRYGNRYFEDRKPKVNTKARRWVIYRGMAEASKVPAEWHGWLHHAQDDIPSKDLKPHDWQKPHKPNLTGTKEAYKPEGFAKSGTYTPPKDYEPWDGGKGGKK